MEEVAEVEHIDKRPRLATEVTNGSVEEVVNELDHVETTTTTAPAGTEQTPASNGEQESENDPKKGRLIKRFGVTSDIWKNFLVWSKMPWIAVCLICQAAKTKDSIEVVIGQPDTRSISTSKLSSHMLRKHGTVTKEAALNNELIILDKQMSTTSGVKASSGQQKNKIVNHFANAAMMLILLHDNLPNVRAWRAERDLDEI